MKIVVVTPTCPHPFGNAAARWYYALVIQLAQFGHRVVCLTGGEDNKQTVQETKKYLASSDVVFRYHHHQPECRILFRKMRSLICPTGDFRFNLGLVRDLEEELADSYDILHLDQLWTGWLGINRPRALLNIHHFEIIDLQYHHPGWANHKRYIQLKRGTKRILKSFKYIRVMTSRLEKKARSIHPPATYFTVPICLDLSLYEMQKPVKEPVVGLFGSMHWYPSRSAGERLIRKIWPLVKERIPDARLLVAGWNAKQYLGHLLPRPGVTLEENLAKPEDFFSKVAVMAYTPVRGSGMKVKNLESMAYGVPVVTTWEGVEGMEYKNSVHCFVEETDDMLAQRIIELLNDFEARLKMRQAARKLMEDKYSPEPTVKAMERIYTHILSEELA